MSVFDRNRAVTILRKLKIANCDPQQLADDLNAICEEYSKAKDLANPKAQISKIGEKLKGIAGSAKTLSGQIASLEKMGGSKALTGRFFTRVSAKDQDFVAFTVTLRDQLDLLTATADSIRLRVLPGLKSKPTKVSVARQRFCGRLLSLFGQIAGEDGTPLEFEPPRSKEGMFIEEPSIRFITEVVRHFPLMKHEMTERAKRRKKNGNPSRRPPRAEPFYQAVAWSVDRLIRGLIGGDR